MIRDRSRLLFQAAAFSAVFTGSALAQTPSTPITQSAFDPAEAFRLMNAHDTTSADTGSARHKRIIRSLKQTEVRWKIQVGVSIRGWFLDQVSGQSITHPQINVVCEFKPLPLVALPGSDQNFECVGKVRKVASAFGAKTVYVTGRRTFTPIAVTPSRQGR